MPEAKTLTILHTNDFHNHLTSAQAAYIKGRKADAGPNSLLLDAGDAISAGNVGVRIGGEPILDLMSDSGYDAMTMGNREFHVADAILRHKIGSARFPVLCANVMYRNAASEALPLIPFATFTLPNKLVVSVIGVTVPMVTARMTARIISAYLFTEPIVAVAELTVELRQKSDIVIALTHIGHKEDLKLAAAVPTLDLVIGGHTHVVLNEPTMVGRVPVLQAGWFGRYLGSVELTVDNGRVTLDKASLTDIRPPDRSQ